MTKQKIKVDYYRDLLQKYMDHIGTQEGIYFLGRCAFGVFTDEENKTLIEIVKELDEQLG